MNESWRGVTKEVRILINKAKDQDWTVTWTSNRHLKFKSPTGVTVTVSPQPHNSRVLAKICKDLENAGLILVEPPKPSTAISDAMAAAIERRQKAEAKVTPPELGEGRPECEPGPIIVINPPKQESNRMTTSGWKKGVFETVIAFLREHPNRNWTAAEISEHVQLTRQQVLNAMTTVKRHFPDEIQIVTRGVYRLVPVGEPATPAPAPVVETPKAAEIKVESVAVTPANDNLSLVERITEIADGWLVKDENGQLYVMKKVSL